MAIALFSRQPRRMCATSQPAWCLKADDTCCKMPSSQTYLHNDCVTSRWCTSAAASPVFVLSDRLQCLREESLPFSLGPQSSPSSQCDPQRKRAAGYNAVILATCPQGGSRGEAERWKDEERLEWFLFSPLESFLSPCPRLETKLIDQENC